MMWLLFSGICVGISLIGWLLTDDINDWYHAEQHELVLDALWDDGDLAESA